MTKAVVKYASADHGCGVSIVLCCPKTAHAFVLATLALSIAATEASDLSLGVAPLTRKVFRDTVVPTVPEGGLLLTGAGYEKVSTQLVIKVTGQKVSGVSVTVAGDLKASHGAVIRRQQVSLLKVVYVPHRVLETDPPNWRDHYPDPIPPLREPLEVPANANQAVLVKVAIVQHCRPGLYQGELRVEAAGQDSRRIALKV